MLRGFMPSEGFFLTKGDKYFVSRTDDSERVEGNRRNTKSQWAFHIPSMIPEMSWMADKGEFDKSQDGMLSKKIASEIVSLETGCNKQSWRTWFISNENNLYIYNKCLLMVGCINMRMESLWFQIRNDYLSYDDKRSLSKTLRLTLWW